MKLYEFANGDTIHKYKKSIVICFQGKRNVLSTGPNNGGFRTDLTAVFNNDSNPGSGMAITLRAPTYREHMDIVARDDLGLDFSSCSGIMTAASMDNASVCTLSYKDFSVTAITTAGVRSNAGRIGDPASWHETGEDSFETVPGTINILLYIEACLSREALASAMVSCTEAKAAAMQELMIGSCYSNGIATGTGTDGIIVISDAQSAVRLTNAGKHSKLGELIGKTVVSSIKESLRLQQNITPKTQHDILKRMGRFGVNEDTLWQAWQGQEQEHNYDKVRRADFADCLDSIKSEKSLVTASALYAHLLDELNWGLLSPAECMEAAKNLFHFAGFEAPCGKIKIKENINITEREKNSFLRYLVNMYENKLVRFIRHRFFDC